MYVAALDADRRRGGVEIFELQLSDLAAIHRVGVVGPELFDVELDHAPADLLVGREADLDFTMLDFGMPDEILDRIHDLRDAGLVVGAEQGRAVRRDEGLPFMVQQFREFGRFEIQARYAPEGNVATVIILDDLGLDVCSGGIGCRIDMGDETQFGSLDARCGGQGPHDITVFVQRGINAHRFQLVP